MKRGRSREIERERGKAAGRERELGGEGLLVAGNSRIKKCLKV